MQQNEFQHIPATFWIYILLPFTVISVTLVGIKTHNPFMFGLIGVIPFCFLLVNRIDLWLVTIFALYNSSLRIPGLLGQLELVDVLIAGLTGVMFLRWIIVKRRGTRKGLMWKFIYLFAIVLVVTIAVRGTGFRLLGDTRWGGMRYVGLLFALAFPIIVLQINLTPKQWRTAIIAMVLLALIPTMADIIFITTNGAVFYQYYWIKHGAVQDAFQLFGTGEMTRLKSAAAGGTAILMIPFILFPLTMRNLWKYVLLILCGVAFLSLSGFRLGLLRAVVFVWLYLFVVLKRHRFSVLAFSCLAGLLAYCFLLLAMPQLPLSVQRTFSFVPFAAVDPSVQLHAQGTIDWRLAVWSNALREIPDYWLLGKGYTYDPQLIASLTENATPTDWARIQSSYHNGPLSLLIGMGIFGLIAGLGILIGSTTRHYRIFAGHWHDLVLKRFHGVFVVLLIVQVGIFLTVYGDVHQSFPGIFRLIGVLEGLALANHLLAESKEKEAAESSDPSDAKPVAAPLPRRILAGV